jgi:hypothetical protein
VSVALEIEHKALCFIFDSLEYIQYEMSQQRMQRRIACAALHTATLWRFWDQRGLVTPAQRRLGTASKIVRF